MKDIDLMLDLMWRALRTFEKAMPSKPEFVRLSFGEAWRFKEKDILQALIQKIARVQSLVRAAKLLYEAGFYQEQSILNRAMDETNEDILFLTYAITNTEVTDLHKRFLEAFWEEEVDESGNILKSEQKREMIPRKKIQAYIARIEGVDLDPHRHQELLRTVTKAYSGYVHGASPQIMDMYGGFPERFHVDGMIGTPFEIDYMRELWNYTYRSFISYIMFSKCIGANEAVEYLVGQLNDIEVRAGIRSKSA